MRETLDHVKDGSCQMELRTNALSAVSHCPVPVLSLCPSVPCYLHSIAVFSSIRACIKNEPPETTSATSSAPTTSTRSFVAALMHPQERNPLLVETFDLRAAYSWLTNMQLGVNRWNILWVLRSGLVLVHFHLNWEWKKHKALDRRTRPSRFLPRARARGLTRCSSLAVRLNDPPT